MKIPLRNGRVFDQRDNENAQHVAMINETFARRFLPNEKPIGQHILLDLGDNKSDALEVVGVVADSKLTDLGAQPAPEMYQPLAQTPTRRLWLVLRTAGASSPLPPPLMQAGTTSSGMRINMRQRDRTKLLHRTNGSATAGQ